MERRIFKIRVLLMIIAGLHPALCLYAVESFPITIAVEFTDHAASAYVADDKGWFEAEGLKPVFHNYITGMALAAALGRGDIQAAYLCLLPAINAYANAGIAIRVVSGLHRHGYGLAVNPEKVKTIKDLEKPGVRIGSLQAGGPVDAILLKTIEFYGLDPDTVLNKVQRINPPMQIMAIRAGKLDAVFCPEHWPSVAEDAGFHLLLKSQDVWPGMPGSVLIVKEELIKHHPEIVNALVKITEKATAWIGEHPEEASSVMARRFQVTGDGIYPGEAAKASFSTTITAQTMKRSMARLDYTTAVDPAAIQAAIDFSARHGYIRKPFPATIILDSRVFK